jgi:CheY-like chemotaxis protein
MDGQPHPGQAVRAPRVLLVDDNTGMRRVLRGVLEDAGIQVVGEATDGLEGTSGHDGRARITGRAAFTATTLDVEAG